MAYGPIEVVHNLCLTVGDGEIVTILGRNGAGKTTTLNGIAGIVKPKSGQISLDGKSLAKQKVSGIARLGVAYVPEGRGVFPTLTVWENLASAAYGHGLGRRAAATEIKRAAAYFPVLEERMKQRAGTMSGGEQQMLAPRTCTRVAAATAAHRRARPRPRAGARLTALREPRAAQPRRPQHPAGRAVRGSRDQHGKARRMCSRRGESRTKAHAKQSRQARSWSARTSADPNHGGNIA